MKISKAYFRGCILGGATADAKAYGIQEDGLDLISDNTQMTSFTVDGLVWAAERAQKKGVYAYVPCLFYAYQKWYYTQTGNLADKSYSFILKGEILRWEQLFARRGQGMTSMNALAGSIRNKFGTLQNRINSSKGCGGMMRAAPIGMLFCKNEETAFRIGCESAALTHGHIDAILPAGFLAYLISGILQGGGIRDVAMSGLSLFSAYPGYEHSYETVKQAIELYDRNAPLNEAMAMFGKGLTGEEAMALSLLCALYFENDFEAATAVTQAFDGNRGTVASVCGNILGANLGSLEIPFSWMKKLELSELMIIGADKLLTAVQEGV